MSQPDDLDAIRESVARSRAEQGKPPRVEDAKGLRDVAAALAEAAFPTAPSVPVVDDVSPPARRTAPGRERGREIA